MLGKGIGVIVVDGKRDKKPGQINGFPWSVDISMEGSQFRSWPLGRLPLAPLDGYADHWHYDSENDGHIRFVFRTDGGLFGLIDCSIWPRQDEGRKCMQFSVYLNEAGARNLDE